MAFSDHPNYAEIEKEREKIFKKIKDKQKERKDGGAAYLQCLDTPADIPGGSTLTAFNLSRKAGHELDDWNALSLSSEVSGGVYCQYFVHCYSGPVGAGFIKGCRAQHNGVAWQYLEHEGPEQRGGLFKAWVEVESASI